jgi:hypothetical protein
MAMVKAIGADLATGVTATGLGGVHEQSATKSSAGEIKVYKNKDGKDISAYVVDKHKEMSFEAIIETSAEDHEIGDVVTISGVQGVVTKWEIIESNEDVKKVSGSIRTFPDLNQE